MTRKKNKDKFKIDFEVNREGEESYSIKDRIRYVKKLIMKGTLGDPENQSTITLTIKGSPGNIEAIETGMQVGLVGDLIRAEFSLISKQQSLWNVLAEKKKEAKELKNLEKLKKKESESSEDEDDFDIEDEVPESFGPDTSSDMSEYEYSDDLDKDELADALDEE